MRVIESLPQPALEEYWRGSRTKENNLYESDGSVALVKKECHNFGPIEASVRIGDIGIDSIGRLIDSMNRSNDLLVVNLIGWVDIVEDSIDITGCRRIACFVAADNSCVFASAAKVSMILKMLNGEVTYKLKKSVGCNIIIIYKKDNIAALLVSLNYDDNVNKKLSDYVLQKPSNPFDTIKNVVGGDDSNKIVTYISALEGIKDDFNSRLQSCYEVLSRDLRDISEEDRTDYKKIMILFNSYVDGVNVAMNAFKVKAELNVPVLSDFIKEMRTEVDQSLFDTRRLDLDP
jgi:archaellum component FlaC